MLLFITLTAIKFIGFLIHTKTLGYIFATLFLLILTNGEHDYLKNKLTKSNSSQ